MPGTRSGEYAHLAVRPGGSRPDMEIEGGRVCVCPQRARRAGRAVTAPSRTCITKSAVSTHRLPRPRPSFTPLLWPVLPGSY